jgi:hypothetical protein
MTSMFLLLITGNLETDMMVISTLCENQPVTHILIHGHIYFTYVHVYRSYITVR